MTYCARSLFITALAFSGSISHAQFLAPVHEDAVGFLQVDFGGGATVSVSDTEFGVSGGMIAEFMDGDFSEIDPYSLYSWCFEVGLQYEYLLGQEEGSGTIDEVFELGYVIPADVLGHLFADPLLVDAVAITDVMALFIGVSGFSPLVWPEPFGIEAEDFYVQIFPDEDWFALGFHTKEFQPEVEGGFNFSGQARLTLKPAGAAVPEPSTFGIIGAGFLVALVFFRRRSMAKKS